MSLWKEKFHRKSILKNAFETLIYDKSVFFFFSCFFIIIVQHICNKKKIMIYENQEKITFNEDLKDENINKISANQSLY